MNRWTIPLFAAALCACAEAENDPPVPGACFHAIVGGTACTGTLDEAIDQTDRALATLGTGGALPAAVNATVREIAEDAVVIAAGDTEIRFSWPDPVPERLAVGAEVTLTQQGAWQIVRGPHFALAALRAIGTQPVPGMPTKLAGGVEVGFAAGCAFGERGGTIDLSIEAGGEPIVLAPGTSTRVGAWTFRHHAGYVAYAPAPPDHDPGDFADGTCAIAAGVAPGPAKAAATAVWESEPLEGTCDPADGAWADAFAATSPAGLDFDGAAPRGSAPGVIASLEGDTVVVALDAGGTARFRWTAALPAELDVGDTVEVARDGAWDELRGDVILAVREEWGFVGGGPIEPALGQIALAFTPRCTFVEADPHCGGPASLATIYGLRLPDGTVLAPGEQGAVGDATVRHDGAVQFPSHGNGQCIVEAFFKGRISVRAPGR